MAKYQYTKRKRDYGTRSKAEYQQDLISASLAAKELQRTKQDKFRWVDVAERFNVSPESLRKRCTNPNVTHWTNGRKPALPDEAEKQIADMVQTANEKYVALTMEALLEHAKKVGEAINRVQPGRVVWQTDNGYPSKKWAQGFIKRHGLSLRKCTGACRC